MFTEGQLKVIKFCAEECRRQHSGEESVYDMVNAWNFASQTYQIMGPVDDHLDLRALTLPFIEEIGRTVEPHDNRKGFRRIPIFVGNLYSSEEKMRPEFIERALLALIEAYYDNRLDPQHHMAITPEDQFYYEYENIHPFRDGNGRSGKVIYNYLRGTLNDPVLPPNYWNISNP